MESGINKLGIWVEVTRFGGGDDIREIAGIRIGDAKAGMRFCPV